MKSRTKRHIVLGVMAVLLFISGAAAGWQVRTAAASKFQGMMQRPATMSQFHYNMLVANVEMLAGRVPFDEDGIGVPFVYGLSPDGKQVMVRVFVISSSLPKEHDARRNTLLITGATVVSSLRTGFGKDVANEDVTVDFVELQKPLQPPVAVYHAGEVTFH